MQEDIKTISKNGISFPGKRHLQYFLWFLIVVLAYGMRANLSVGILAMTSEQAPNPNVPTYPQWTLKNIMLSSFFWGYVVFQILIGKVSQRWGAKWPLTYAMFINSLFCILTPIFAEKLGEAGVITCRVMQGLHQGFFYPSMHGLAEKWCPISERSTAIGFVYAASGLGTFISMLVTGQISETIGWPYSFYLYGSLGFLWVILWIMFGSNEPSEHKTISEKERNLIEGQKRHEDNEMKKTISTPWKEIFTSAPFWAILITYSGFQWGFWVLLTETPSYLKNIMHYDVGASSFLAAGPYLTLWLLIFIFGPMTDVIINRKIVSIGNARKLLTTISCAIPGAAMCWLAFLDATEKVLAIVLLFVAVGFSSAAYAGFNCNHIDIAPIHSGVLMGLTNAAANLVASVAPLSLDLINKEETDPDLWKFVFLLAASINLSANIIYLIFASGDIQPWNNKQQQQQINEKDLEKNSFSNKK